MQPHSTETMTERTPEASPPLSQSAKRKREEENEEDAGSSSSKLCELWTADGGVCRDIWRTHVVKYLNPSDRKFFYSVNKETRKAMKELPEYWWYNSVFLNYFSKPFRISQLSSISTLEVAWENYDFTKANARGHFIQQAAATGDVELLRWVREEKGVDRRMQKIVESAVKSGHLNVVQYCAEKGWNINNCDFVFTAAEFGRLDIVQYLHEERGVRLDAITTHVAARKGELEVLKYLHEMNTPWDPRVATAAAFNADPNFECLKFCVANGCALDWRSMAHVIRKGDLQMIQMMHEAGAPWHRDHINAIYSHAQSNRFNILKYCVDNGLELDERACKLAVEYNDLKGLQYLREKGAPWDASLPTLCAREYRDIVLLKFCLSNGCPVNGADACAQASEWGGLEHLKYLRNEGCQWDQRTTQYARRVDILRYAVENGCPVNGPEACAAAVRQGVGLTGSIEKLIYLRKSGYNWDARTSFEAAAKSYLDCLKYCIENGCSVDETACANAAKCNRLRNLKYLKANNAPWDHRTVLNARRKDILKFALDNGCPKPPSNAF